MITRKPLCNLAPVLQKMQLDIGEIRMERRKLAGTMLLVPFLFAAGAQAAKLTEEGRQTVSQTLAKLGEKIDRIEPFDGPGPLAGLIVQGGAEPAVVLWATPDGKYLFAGNLLDAGGRNLTDIAARHYKAENPINVTMNEVVESTIKELLPKSIQVETLERMRSILEQGKADNQGKVSLPEHGKVPLKQIETTIETLITTGNVIAAGKEHDAAGRLVIFHDPLCPFCRSFLNEVQAKRLWDRYAVYWVPVLSVGKPEASAALVQNPTLDTLLAIEKNPDARIRSRMPDTEAKRIVDGHTTLFGAMISNPATPTIVARNAKGETRIFVGADLAPIETFLDVRK